MNRSYSKIRHIQECNLKLEKSRLTEDDSLDDIFNKLKDTGFDSLDFYEKSILDNYKKYVESNKNSNDYSSPERGYQSASVGRALRNALSGNPTINKVDVGTIYDEGVKDEDDYIATFDGKMFININDRPKKYDLEQYEKIDCIKTLEDFSKKYPVWCYKTFQYYEPKLFTNSNDTNKSSDYPQWWWDLQEFDELSTTFRENNLNMWGVAIKKEQLVEKMKTLFSKYLEISRFGCLEIYKKK